MITNEKEALQPNMLVTAMVDLGMDYGVLTIPVAAVQGDETHYFVFKVVNDTAIKTPVEIVRAAGDIAIVGKGLYESDIVITGSSSPVKVMQN